MCSSGFYRDPGFKVLTLGDLRFPGSQFHGLVPQSTTWLPCSGSFGLRGFVAHFPGPVRRGHTLWNLVPMQWEHSGQLINGSCLTIVGDWPYSRDATPIHFHQTAALLEDCHFKLSQFFALVFLLNYLNLHICINTVYIIHTLVKHPFWASFLNYSNYLKHIYILQDRI